MLSNSSAMDTITNTRRRWVCGSRTFSITISLANENSMLMMGIVNGILALINADLVD